MNDSAPKTAGLLCPACRVNLLMTDRQGIEVDYCPDCRGVWLDRGELDKIIERSQRLMPDTRAPASADVSEGNYGHHGSRKGAYGHHRRSWLQKIFD